METIDQIQIYLDSIPSGEIFTTKQMLKYGERKHVDKALFELVLKGRIRRLTYGVFCLASPNFFVSPMVQSVLTKKCKGNQNSLAHLNHDSTKESSGEIVYYTLGYSTSFVYQGRRIILKKICGRKFKLSQTSTGRLLLSLWLHGRTNVDAQMVHDQLQTLSLDEKTMLRSYIPLLPGWLHDLVFRELELMGLGF